MNYQKSKRQLRAKIALKENPDTDGGDLAYSLNCRGWRLSDGVEYPVTVTRIPTKEQDNA